ncbi:hypothetical protein NQ318_001590 [Aromia moschata]|uniref:Uncharacterized protein n=1 Tax=Aromia moschata TaxID=1265417 RepID=A0AAV8Y0Z6_9CUCU|nr:hypothetical protein NQ318_001590 [Aromia moschata]
MPILALPPIEFRRIRRSSDCYSRISLLDVKKKNLRHINLDEIIPVLEETDCNHGSISSERETGLVEEPKTFAQPEAEQVLLLNPLLLETLPRAKPRLTQSEHKKIARITIVYTLAFFALALLLS